MATKQTARAAKVTKVVKAARPRRLFDTQFLRDIYAELKKVVWPTREETTNLTVVVIVVSVAVGLLLGLIDLGFFWVINSGLLGAG